MDVQLLSTIPYWESRLQAKMLEKKAFWGNVAKAGLTMGGRGAKVGAGLGAGLGGIDYMTSNDPNKSLLGSVGGGAVRGGMLGGTLGFGAGAGLRMAPGALKGAAGISGEAAALAKAAPLGSAATNAHNAASAAKLTDYTNKLTGYANKAQGWQDAAGLAGKNVAMPGWASTVGGTAKKYLGPTLMGR